MGLLGGTEERVMREKERKGRIEMEEDVNWEEVKKVIESLKINKAVGKDGIPNEVWKYGGEKLEKWVWEICKRV
ncbi:rna-directed dna polymerase from mobile element jockey-like protein [Lasius niger]|uniref:Rna-directed dna polymerase from mobile element jockey-like protein n=1 Tax=Lasius niger TaxID=67767 RepID=A0A0J7K9D4_LASNI|nr:rna-directed dna polymerase from mobile element jockey-like protein [Lasius niger]KMQ86831.1 rna-directed dna polymerase from mobile element jockey-like protein [Lasius niger]